VGPACQTSYGRVEPLGTPRWCAPEAGIIGVPAEDDIATPGAAGASNSAAVAATTANSAYMTYSSDIWAVGLVLYHLVLCEFVHKMPRLSRNGITNASSMATELTGMMQAFEARGGVGVVQARFCRLVREMAQVQLSRRPTAERALQELARMKAELAALEA